MISTITGVMSDDISHQSPISVDSHVMSHEFHCIFEKKKNDFLHMLLT